MKKMNTEEEAIAYCFSQLKPSIIGMVDYNRLRIYKQRYEKKKLGQKGLHTLLTYFGFTDHTQYSYDPNHDNSVK